MSHPNIQNIPEIPLKDLTEIKPLGKGGNGSVKLYYYQRKGDKTRVEIAVKLLDKYNDTKFKKEVEPLLRLQHKNFIGLLGKTKIGNDWGILLEYMEGGDLYNVIHHRTSYRYSLRDVLNWNLQSARALEYMHSCNDGNQGKQSLDGHPPYIHRDIKPQNMLLDSTFQTLKICDFGTSKEIRNLQNTPGRGTYEYMAPEVLSGGDYDDTCDVYSWTLTFWECLTGLTPFQECLRNVELIKEKKKVPNYLAYVSTASFWLNMLIQNGSNNETKRTERTKRISMKSWRKVLEILIENCNLMEKQNQKNNNVCIWNERSTGEFFYAKGLENYKWKFESKFQDFDPESFEEFLESLKMN